MDFDAASSIYIQIGERIREEIIRGEYRPGDRLKSVREYAVFYEVSPLTMHRALQYLEAQGLIVTKKGVGSFVTPRLEPEAARNMQKERIRQFLGQMGEMGLAGEELLERIRECMKEEEDHGNEE